MMSLRGFCLVMSTVLAWHFATAESQEDWHSKTFQLSPHWLVGYCVVFCVLGKVMAAVAAARAAYVSDSVAWRQFESQRAILEWLWTGSQSWMLSTSSLASQIAACESLGWSEALLLAIWFIPSVIFLAALEFSAAQLEFSLSSRMATTDTRALLLRWVERLRLGSTGGMIMGLVPVLLVLGAIDLVQWWLPGLPESVHAVIALLVLGLGCLTLAPLWMKTLIGARAFQRGESVPNRVAELCAAMRVAMPQVLCVGRSHAWQGAALVGWTRLSRQLWLGNALLHRLDDHELDMVLLHELAHLKRGHCWWRLLPLLVCAIAMVAVLALFPADITHSALHPVAISPAVAAAPPAPPAAILASESFQYATAHQANVLLNLSESIGQPIACILIACAAIIVFLLSWVSQRCEFDADYTACLMASRICGWASNRPDRAADALTSALTRLHDGEASRRTRHWLHPSVQQRAESLHVAFMNCSEA